MSLYNPGFAHIYNVRWTDFAREVAPVIQRFYEAHSPDPIQQRLLDLCCGTGQLALHFLAQGYTVLGLDISPGMLAYAIENARPYMETGHARFIQGDAADFRLAETFGLVVSTFDALNHLPDLAALQGCFQCVHAVLAEGGWFIFDLNTASGLRARWTGITVQDTEEVMIVTRGFILEEAARAYTRITGFCRREDGLYERFEQTAFNTLYDLDAVASALRDAGFAEAHFARLRALDIPLEAPESESRVWIVARK